MEDASLEDFASGGAEDRPDAEAAAVAGADTDAAGGPGAAVVDPEAAKFPDPEGTVELMVTQVDYTVESDGGGEYPVVHVFGRTPDNEAEHVRVLGVEPYFYVPAEVAADRDLVAEYDAVLAVRERPPGGGEPFESIREEPLAKVVTRTPRDVGRIRDDFAVTYEADILFPNRFLIDYGVRSGLRVRERRLPDGTLQVPGGWDAGDPPELEPAEVTADLRVNTFDIEVDDRSGFPEDGEEPIVCLTAHDSYRDEYVAWLYEAPEGDVPAPAELADHELLADDGAVDVRAFETETAMLDDFLAYLSATDPDVTCGWNFEDFDAPYLLDRLEVLGMDPDRLSRVDEVWRSSGGWGGPKVKGRVVFDLLYAYQRTQFTELESYRLDAVAELELGASKERYPGDVGDLWEDDPERLLEYNLRDVELCVEIDRKQRVVAFWDEVRRFVGCKLEDAPTPGDAVDMYVLQAAHGEFALPTKGQQAGEEFEGGAVFDPITGVKEMVSVLDLACFSGDTELMTPDGPREVTEVDVGDRVYTLDPETFECEVTPVTETHAYENTYGELHHISGTTHDLKVTENHRFLVSNERGWADHTPQDFTFEEYRDLTGTERYAFPSHRPMEGASPEQFSLVDEVEGGHVVVVHSEDDLRAFRARVPDAVTEHLDLVHGSSAALGLQQKVGKYLLPVSVYRDHREAIDRHADEVRLKNGRGHRETPLAFDMADWLEFLGWYVTEGSLGSGTDCVTLHQSDDEGRAAIRSLLDRMDLNYSVDERGFDLSNRFLHDWLERHCGRGSENKRLPEWVFDLDAALLEGLVETMIEGDGEWSESGLGEFWTGSDRLKRDIARCAVRCGEKPTVTETGDGLWYVSVGKRGSFNRSVNGTVEDHDGRVYCVTTADNHVVMAGRNGRFQWVGQSLYPMAMTTMNASPETKVGEDYDGETYVAPNGQRFRKEPDGMMRELIDDLLAEREEKKARRDEHDPDSPAYEQFDRQQAAVKVIMNCFTPDTEVLTPDGVRNIRELSVGDEVYSLDPDTEELEVKPVTETHAYPDYRGDLVDIETDKIGLRVTPNHRMLVRKDETNGRTWDGYRFVAAGDLDRASNYRLPHDWEGPTGRRIGEVDLTEWLDDYEVWCDNDVHGHTPAAELGWYPDAVQKADEATTGYVLSADEFGDHRDYLDDVCSTFYVHAESGRKWVPRFYDGDDFLELLAWYITEGSVYTSEPKRFGEHRRGSATSVSIAQDAVAADGGDGCVAGDDHARIGKLLDRMGFDYYVDEGGYQFTSKLLGEFLERTCGGSSAEKRVPEFVFGASQDQKRAFLNTLVAGDGDRQENAWRYSTASERLRDDVLRLCAHLGLTANYRKDSGAWRIHVTEDARNTLRMHRSASRTTADDGVYCVTVADNHTLLAGRDGKFQFVGQSLYGVSGWERFRLYDKENAAAITATGREVIEFTQEAAAELDKEVVYGDSVTGDRPVVVRDPDGTVRISPIAELFERATPYPELPGGVTADGGSAGQSSDKEHASLDGWDALSLSRDGEPEWQPIEGVVRHETDKPVVNLQHKFGESTTTTDHSYVVRDGDRLAEVAPENVEEPLRIPGLPEVEGIERIDVYEVLRGYEREYEDGRGTGGTTMKTKRVHADDEFVWFGHEHHGDLDSTVKVERFIEVGSPACDSLLRLLAAYVTEGSASTKETTESKFGASIAETRAEWLEALREDYLRLFRNTEASVTAGDGNPERTLDYETAEGTSTVTYNDGTRKLQMMNELAAVFFREFAGQTSQGKRIPGFVYHLPDDKQELFVETLVEGDGSREFPRYSEEYAERNFDFETTSRELAAGISTLLTQRDRKHSLEFRDEKDSYTIRTCDHYRRGRDPVLTPVENDGYVYDLSVAENENFVDGVGGIVLHNTDSVMLELGHEVSKAEAIEQSFAIEEHINGRYDDFAREELNAEVHRFRIEFEKLYRRFFQAGKKKRYAGHIVWKEGKDVDDVDITGFEYKRSDIAPITKRVQREVIETIVRGEGDVGDVEEAVTDYLHEVISEFKAGEVSLDEVGIPGGIGKRLDAYDTDTAQVRGAKYANLLLGTNFQRGSKPKRLYLAGVHPDFWRRMEDERGLDPQADPRYRQFKREVEDGDGVICFEYADQVPEEFEVDWEKMLEKTLQGPIARVIEALGISWDEVESGQQQTGLGSFT